MHNFEIFTIGLGVLALVLLIIQIYFTNNNETILKVSHFCIALFIPSFGGIVIARAFEFVMSFF